MQLEEKHIQNLKIVLNRNMFLELMPKNGVVAELGVDEGLFSEKILSVTKPKKLYLIDCWDSKRFNQKKEKSVETKFKSQLILGNVIMQKGFSYEELEKYDDNYFDWVYIDTSHSYKDTVRELEVSRAKVKECGLIAGHDYSQGNIDKPYKYGVVAAVNEFCIKYNWEMVYLTHEPDRYLSFALRRIKK